MAISGIILWLLAFALLILLLEMLLRRNITWDTTKGRGVILLTLLSGRNPFRADILSNAQHNDTEKPTTEPAQRIMDRTENTLLVADF